MMNPLRTVRMLSNTRYLIRRLQARFIQTETLRKKFPVVVDIGVGRAPHKKYIQHEQYIGVDIEDRGGVPNVLIEDINNGLSLSDNCADLVLCTEVIEHTKKPDVVVKELYRITKPGGVVLLTTPMVWPVHEAPNDFFRYTPFGAKYLFENAGFTDVRSLASNGYLYTMAELSVIHMRHWIFSPVVVLVNLCGFIVGRLEKNHSLPLGIQVRAVK